MQKDKELSRELTSEEVAEEVKEAQGLDQEAASVGRPRPPDDKAEDARRPQFGGSEHRPGVEEIDEEPEEFERDEMRGVARPPRLAPPRED